MLLEKRKVVAEGTSIASYGFKIGDGAAILDMLRNQIYSNPIESICREIASNGRDAQRERGNADRPLQITLPTAFEPTMKFRDFGVGMTPQRIEEIYVNYGVSTKRNSNDQTGGFGLGAKTPFSYKPSFTIITIVPNDDGKYIKRIYSASIGEDRHGGVHLLAEMETNEEQGTEISFLVDSEDFTKFEESLGKSVRFWDVRPTVINSTGTYESQINKPIDVILEEDNWQLVLPEVDPIYYYKKRPVKFVIVDGISYEFSVSSCLSQDNHELYELADRANFIVRFNTGDLDLSANRESLNYSLKTKSVLETTLLKIKNTSRKKLAEEVSKSENYTAAQNLIEDYSKNTGIKITDLYWKNSLVVPKNKRCVFENDLMRIVRYRKDSYNNNIRFKRVDAPLACFDEPIIINKKTDTIPQFLVDEIIKKHSEFLVVVSRNSNIQEAIDHFKEKNKIDINDLDPIDLHSFEPKFTLSKTKKVPNKKSNAYVFFDKGSNQNWAKERLDLEKETGYYLIVENRKQDIFAKKGLPNCKDRMSILFHYAQKHGGTSFRLIGIKENQIKKLGKGARPFSEFLEEHMKELEKEFSLEEIVAAQNAFYELMYDEKNKYEKIVSFLEALDPNHIVLALAKEFENKRNYWANFCEFLKVAKHALNIPYDLNSIQEDKKFYSAAEEVINKYPLYKYISNSVLYNPEAVEHLKNYKQMIDNK